MQWLWLLCSVQHWKQLECLGQLSGRAACWVLPMCPGYLENRKKGREARVSSDDNRQHISSCFPLSVQVGAEGGKAQNRQSTCRQWEETSSPKDWTGVNTSIQRPQGTYTSELVLGAEKLHVPKRNTDPFALRVSDPVPCHLTWMQVLPELLPCWGKSIKSCFYFIPAQISLLDQDSLSSWYTLADSHQELQLCCNVEFLSLQCTHHAWQEIHRPMQLSSSLCQLPS